MPPIDFFFPVTADRERSEADEPAFKKKLPKKIDPRLQRQHSIGIQLEKNLIHAFGCAQATIRVIRADHAGCAVLAAALSATVRRR
jgi:hypothetical protein